MDSIKFDYSKICNFVTKEEMIALYPEARQALKSLKEGTGKGSDFLGWLNLPVEITSEQLADIEKTAAELRARTQVMVVIGIGGSYLGARAVIEALADSFHNYENTGMKVIFAGHNIGEDYYHELIHYLSSGFIHKNVTRNTLMRDFEIRNDNRTGHRFSFIERIAGS